MSYGFKIMVEGDYACFTRPEMKVERVSYDVPTPGAMEGLLKAIYWKPAIRYVIDKIVVFNPIEFFNIKRNEVSQKVLLSAVKSQMKGKGSPQIYTNECIAQRSSMILKNVKYGIEFHFEMTGIKSDHEDECEEKHHSIILRRLENGQFFRQPVLGCREFSASRIELVDDFDLSLVSESLMGDTDLGFMLYGMEYANGGLPIDNDWKNPRFSDIAEALYYRPHLIDGVINVAEYRRGLKC